VDLSVLNKRAIESLIKAGAFDSMGHPRRGLLMVFEQIIDTTVTRRRREMEGQFDLFSQVEQVADAPPVDRLAIPELRFDKREKLALEKEMLGLYVSDHPLMGAESALRRRVDATLEEALESADGALITVGGVVTALQRKWTKRGELMAVFTLEDLQAQMEVMVFPKTMTNVGHLLSDDAVITLRARVDRREDTPKLVAMDVTVFEGIVDGAPPLRIRVSAPSLSDDRMSRFKSLLSEFPGESAVFLHVDERQVVRLPDAFCVQNTPGLAAELRVLFGPGCLL
jgi:DNA polymerase-3 subunit alpha